MAFGGQYQRFRRHLPKAGVAAVLVLSLAVVRPVNAWDNFDFRAPGASEDLVRSLKGASALMGLRRDENENAQDVFTAARADYGRLLAALYARGHYSAVITIRLDGREAASIAPLDAPDVVRRVEVTVDPGLRFTFGVAQVAPLVPGTQPPESFRRGETARSGAITEAAQSAVDGWRARAHAKASVTGQDLLADHGAARLDARLTVTPGPRLTFGRLSITGLERMREDRVRAIAGFPEGAPFDPKALARAAERLRRSGVFAAVTLTEDEAITPPDRIGISATLAEQMPRRYSFGGEISSLDGATLRATWLHRNLFGGAERLSLSGEVRQIGAQTSGTDYFLSATLERPATLRPDTTAVLNFGLGHLVERDFSSDTVEFGIGFTNWVTEKATWRIGLDYQYSRVTDDLGTFTNRILSLPLGLLYDDRDLKLDARRGRYLDIELRPFLGLGDTESGLRATADLRLYRSFGENDRVTLAGRVQVGTVSGASLTGAPRDFLFYSGGGGTVRGQPFQSLGVTLEPSGVGIGGRSFLAASAELRGRFGRNWGAVAFYDVGYVGAGEFFSGPVGSHAGAGLGVRFDTGFGPIRLDVAVPVSGDDEGEGVQVYVGIGQAF